MKLQVKDFVELYKVLIRFVCLFLTSLQSCSGFNRYQSLSSIDVLIFSTLSNKTVEIIETILMQVSTFYLQKPYQFQTV